MPSTNLFNVPVQDLIDDLKMELPRMAISETRRATISETLANVERTLASKKDNERSAASTIDELIVALTLGLDESALLNTLLECPCGGGVTNLGVGTCVAKCFADLARDIPKCQGDKKCIALLVARTNLCVATCLAKARPKKSGGNTEGNGGGTQGTGTSQVPSGYTAGAVLANQNLFRCKEALICEIPAGVCVTVTTSENGGGVGDAPGQVDIIKDGKVFGSIYGDGSMTVCGPATLKSHLKAGEDKCKIMVTAK